MDTLALILSIIGCANWGLVGIFRFDLVAWTQSSAGSFTPSSVWPACGASRCCFAGDSPSKANKAEKTAAALECTAAVTT